ncbi:MAG: T9SS type A sorting domain-containing protein, partial [Bacteroidales bacterium]|nr:T9SS type A sorting domain-containing protein [Bacteroidales bacterium]
IGTGLPQYLTENDVVVYPNPVADQLTVTLRTDAFRVSDMAVYDLNGKLVMAQSVEDNQISVNASRLATGSYFLRLSDGKNSVTTKFVKR